MLKKSKSLEVIQEVIPKVLVTSNSYHGTGNFLANTTSQWNHKIINKFNTKIIESKIDLLNLSIKKSKDIEHTIEESKIIIELKAKKSYDTSTKTFREALKHDCFYDVISQKDGNVTITFLPFSTSNNIVPCGLQKFDKIHLFTNGLKKFYITRILFNVTMTKTEFIAWEANSKLWYQDKNFRKSLFNEIQKDLDINSYSILKDTDIENPTVEFFNKELPFMKFKFTDFEF